MSSNSDYGICAICMEDMTHRKPRMLPCVHSYCTECLKKMLTQPSNVKKSIITCPVCRKSIKLPSQGVEAIPINFLLTDNKLDNVNNKDTKCSICLERKNDVQAIVRCRECRTNLCHACRKKHNETPALQHHNLRRINSDLCLDHKEVLEYYCDFCDSELCSHCIFSPSHNNHRKDISSIKERCNTLQTLIKDKTEDMQKHLNNKLAHLKHVKERNKCIEEEISVRADQILVKIKQDIERSKDLLVRELTKDKSDIEKLESSVQNSLQKMIKAGEICKETKYDSDFYSMLQCCDVSVEFDAEAGRKLCRTSVPIPRFQRQKIEAIYLGKLQSTSEDLDCYPVPKYEDNPYDLDKISVCTDTIYELFLSRKRAEYRDTEESDKPKQKPPIKERKITKEKKQAQVNDDEAEEEYVDTRKLDEIKSEIKFKMPASTQQYPTSANDTSPTGHNVRLKYEPVFREQPEELYQNQPNSPSTEYPKSPRRSGAIKNHSVKSQPNPRR